MSAREDILADARKRRARRPQRRPRVVEVAHKADLFVLDTLSRIRAAGALCHGHPRRTSIGHRVRDGESESSCATTGFYHGRSGDRRDADPFSHDLEQGRPSRRRLPRPSSSRLRPPLIVSATSFTGADERPASSGSRRGPRPSLRHRQERPATQWMKGGTRKFCSPLEGQSTADARFRERFVGRSKLVGPIILVVKVLRRAVADYRALYRVRPPAAWGQHSLRCGPLRDGPSVRRATRLRKSDSWCLHHG